MKAAAPATVLTGRALRPDSGRPARGRSTAFRDGWTAWRRDSGNPAAPRNAVSSWEAGAPAERRFTVGSSDKSVARCHRTVLAYWKFESISLQRRVSSKLGSGPASVRRSSRGNLRFRGKWREPDFLSPRRPDYPPR